MDRRRFIKLAGISAAAGLGGAIGAGRVLRATASSIAIEPAGGTRWAMVVDISKFRTEAEYMKSINACHSVHNVPDFGNPKDEIKWIWTDTYEHVFPGMEHSYLNPSVAKAPFMVLCNHCSNPPCVRVCPTQATFKRPDGIVAMDYHRCIGCRFCMAACPYGARSFNWRDPRPFIDKARLNTKYPTRTKGVVEKCNFCVERIGKDLEPACVEAAKGTGAMVFGDLNDKHSEVREVLSRKFTIRRKPRLGTEPGVYYVIGGAEDV